MQTHEIGTTKGEFFSSLNLFGSGEAASFFPLVVLACPRSRLEFSSDPELKEVLAPALIRSLSAGSNVASQSARGITPVL